MFPNRLPVFILFGVLAVALTGCLNMPKVKYVEESHHSVDAAGVENVDAETTNGSIAIAGTEIDELIVDARKEIQAYSDEEAQEFARKVEIVVERSGNEVRIYKQHPKPPRGVQVSVSFDIQAPRGVDVVLKSTNGRIRVDDTDGRVHAVTTNGSIEVRGRTRQNDLQTTNGAIFVDGADASVTAKTTNGSIDVRGGKGNVEAITTNGKIDLDRVAGRVHAKTTNGSIHAGIARLEKSGDFSSSNGSITVRIEEGAAPITVTSSNAALDVTLPSEFSGSLDAESRYGKIRTEFPVTSTMTEPDKHKISGSIGSGEGPLVKLRSSNGQIQVRKR